MERRRVLIVEDEAQIVEVVRAYLEREGFIVESCASVAAALAALERFAPDVLVLDITLPDGSGLDVLRSAGAADARVPTIVLTARGDEADRVVGLELGADDYVTKPFSPRELVARVRALLRRTSEGERAAGVPVQRTRVGDLEIDHTFHEVRVRGVAANLTATEFKILTVLGENPGEVFTRSHLLDRLGDDGEIYERTLDRHINNLRKKIERDPRNPEYLVTVYGVGYKLRKL
ncbi:MAG TPA: response regulator transcription factor [Candidatus Binatia bacterium]|nr:response regulator transcription factor [Candidatus Binatia bacterium]